MRVGVKGSSKYIQSGVENGFGSVDLWLHGLIPTAGSNDHLAGILDSHRNASPTFGEFLCVDGKFVDNL